MIRLPATGIHHSLPAAWFALRCLAWAIAHRPVEFFTQAVLGHSPLNPKE